MIAGPSAIGALTQTPSAASSQAAAASSDGAGFEAALGQALGSAAGALQSGEATAIQGITGAAAPLTVVESVMEAQRSLQSVLAIRDKLVSAWQEVARMAI
jgi:flagellar hook-basal body complex protein FliE